MLKEIICLILDRKEHLQKNYKIHIFLKVNIFYKLRCKINNFYKLKCREREI